ncbi:ureidoglycolate dehydrogenase [Streptococcus zalophi]|uniref:Ureidoglycolate dehydrogenase n=1 Tax=Streptococcus zalophi TaxID=640031 RepID=A0A934P9P6_9STRE|nr:ureidoglycolate dehydrogenase [Streptococcus zalophi]MBJ8349613.1 ureidoglycolate dehydrogenase [Streptococcus zalophi]MCR8968038.1 ureidoglycolate dehydrogenase [Streptococcus zalophi]
MDEQLIRIKDYELHQLIFDKLHSAGLPEEQAQEVANHLVFADLSGIHSHGAVRVDYYAERIDKGGVTRHPNLKFEKTGASTGIYHGDNAQGHYVANLALEPIIEMAKETGVAIVGLSKVSHTGTMSYYLEKLANEDLVAISICQSDPMVVPFGGSEVYYGTNPIGFGAPRKSGRPVIFDMATTVQAWGKILDARSKGKAIPETWAVDSHGVPTTDPMAVAGLLPLSGPKGYGLMMMVDMLSGVMLGLPFGKHVSSMYADMTKGRDLGHLFIVIDPSRFINLEIFKNYVEQSINELHEVKPAKGFEQVYYPGEPNILTYQKNKENGINIPKWIIDYLKSETLHFDKYGDKDPFAK